MVKLFFYRKFKKLKNVMNFVHCQKQSKYHQHILNKIKISQDYNN